MKIRMLDLFCGAGGAAMGYYRAFVAAGLEIEITGVDIKPQPNYPFAVRVGDAMAWPLRSYDFIHASPPCQGYSPLTKIGGKSHPMLISAIRARLRSTGKPWEIENVATAPLINPIMLCGTMFGLGVARHRLFESNIYFTSAGKCHHTPNLMTILTKSSRTIGDLRTTSSVVKGRIAMGIDWMTQFELGEAIPPAYTQFLGKQIAQMFLTGQRTAFPPTQATLF